MTPMSSYVRYILYGIVVLAVLDFARAYALAVSGNETAGLTAGSPRAPTEAELQAIYKALPPEDRDAIDAWSVEQRRSYLLSRWHASSRAQSIPDKTPPITSKRNDAPPHPQPYKVDPVLEQAYRAAMDPNRPGRDGVELLTKYIQANPDTPFLAEIYYILGSTYSIWLREGEPRNISAQVEYYTKAHGLFGRKFSYLNDAAWATLANRSKSLKDLREYYDWLLEFQAKGGVDDVYPIRMIAQDQLPLEHTRETREVILSNAKANLPEVIRVAEDNILHMSSKNYQRLAELAAAYPKCRLGQFARERLDLLDRKASTGAMRKMNDPEFLTPSPAPEELPHPSKPAVPAGPAAEAQSLQKQNTVAPGRHPFFFPILAGVLLAGVAVLLVVWYTRTKRRGAKSSD